MLSLTFTNFQNKSTRWPDRDLYDRRELVLISLLSSASARINKKWKFLEAALRSWKELLFWKVTRSLPDLGKCIFWWLISAVVVVKIDFFFSVFSLLLQDPDRDWSGHSPDGPGRAGLSEQRRVTCLIKLEHDGIFSSQKETGVIFVCCTFTPLFHSTIKKKSFWSKITNVFISVYSEYSDFCLLPFLQHIHGIFSAHIFCSCKQTSWFHQLCFFSVCRLNLAAGEMFLGTWAVHSSTSQLPVVGLNALYSLNTQVPWRGILTTHWPDFSQHFGTCQK